MANTTGGGGSQASTTRMISKEILAAAFAADLDRMTRRFAGGEYATVTNVDWLASAGYFLAAIGSHEVRVIASANAAVVVGQEVFIRRMSADSNAWWEYSGGGSGETATEYALCFGDPANNTIGSVYINWAGTIQSVKTSGTGSVSFTATGASVTVGSALGAGEWLVATISGGSGDYFSVAVIVA